MIHVYVLQSTSSGRLYVGQTSSVERRLAQHTRGEVLSTRGRGPWELLGCRGFETRSAAVRLERALKALKRPERVRAVVAAWPRIPP